MSVVVTYLHDPHKAVVVAAAIAAHLADSSSSAIVYLVRSCDDDDDVVFARADSKFQRICVECCGAALGAGFADFCSNVGALGRGSCGRCGSDLRLVFPLDLRDAVDDCVLLSSKVCVMDSFELVDIERTSHSKFNNAVLWSATTGVRKLQTALIVGFDSTVLSYLNPIKSVRSFDDAGPEGRSFLDETQTLERSSFVADVSSSAHVVVKRSSVWTRTLELDSNAASELSAVFERCDLVDSTAVALRVGSKILVKISLIDSHLDNASVSELELLENLKQRLPMISRALNEEEETALDVPPSTPADVRRRRLVRKVYAEQVSPLAKLFGGIYLKVFYGRVSRMIKSLLPSLKAVFMEVSKRRRRSKVTAPQVVVMLSSASYLLKDSLENLDFKYVRKLAKTSLINAWWRFLGIAWYAIVVRVFSEALKLVSALSDQSQTTRVSASSDYVNNESLREMPFEKASRVAKISNLFSKGVVLAGCSRTRDAEEEESLIETSFMDAVWDATDLLDNLSQQGAFSNLGELVDEATIKETNFRIDSALVSFERAARPEQAAPDELSSASPRRPEDEFSNSVLRS